MVYASRPVASASRLAALPVGDSSRYGTPRCSSRSTSTRTLGSTASPIPTEKASSPSFAAPATSRRAIVTCSGRSSASRSADPLTRRGRGIVVIGGLSFLVWTPPSLPQRQGGVEDRLQFLRTTGQPRLQLPGL